MHAYFRGVSDEALREIASIAEVAHYDAGVVVHEAGQALTTVCFVLTGRIKAVRVDSEGREHFFRIFERDEQYGMVLGSVAEPIPVRAVALEPTTILSLDYEQSMELTLKYADLRRHWLNTYARSMQRHYFETSASRTTSFIAVVHESHQTRHLAVKLIERLRELGEDIGVLSDTETWRSMSGVRFRSLLEGDRRLDVTEIRQQLAEWHTANRVVMDIRPDPDPVRAARIMETADRVLVFVRPRDIESVLQRMRAIDVQARGWRDKINIVWLLDPGSNVPPAVPQFRHLVARDFKISESPVQLPWGHLLANGMERLVHFLRGVQIGVALGGGAARGLAHLGVLKALEQHGIVVDMVAGTSSGAMTGVLYSAGLDSDYSARAFANDLKLPWLLRRLPNGGYWYLLYKYRRGHFEPMLRRYLKNWTLEQLLLPCYPVTVDLISGKAVIREEGEAGHGILESINLPVLAKPICRNGQALIDGALMNNLPADVLVSRGCNFVIAVPVTATIEHRFGQNHPLTPTPNMKAPSAIQTILRSLLVQSHNLNFVGVRSADVVIQPDVTGFDLTEFMRAKEIAAVGEQTTLSQLPNIKKLLHRLDPQIFKEAP